ncbi:hypothetical protein DWX25_00825 [Collinsella sp. AF18-8LB]|nr:hypothetical protein DXD49_02255 [Collinsella sp. TM05-38]RGM74884.1 hypothetical protein DXB98_04100 [Collinsella sp. OM07-12]RGT47760.1 hypothetical protein DWX25_00825 [Collinsella sp. AF18-8LB]RGT52233.1 hypothetical protein DWX24_00615 [Collinsella sp. AF18-8]RGT67620.1 hypothetical protein DWX16_01710 [Collinsella sp. AF18-33LB]
MPKDNPTDQDIKQQPINAPRWDDTPPVRLIDWVFEVPQVAAKEERSVLWYASDGLSGEMGCLGKPDVYSACSGAPDWRERGAKRTDAT